MFTLKINGIDEPYEVVQETTFGHVIENLSAKMNHAGKVITQIQMNDQTMAGGKQVEYYMYPLANVETIEISADDPKKLALEALGTLLEYKKELKRNSERAAELFRLGDDLEANEMYSRLIEGWRWLVKGVDAMCGMMKIDVNTILSKNMTVQHFQKNLLLPVFDNMFEAQKREDWIELADILEFELAPLHDDWEGFLNQMKKYLD